MKMSSWMILAGSLAVATAGFGQELKLEKTTFGSGEQIKVSFTAPATYPANAWVGIIPSAVKHGVAALNDDNNMGFQYLNKKTSGVLVFVAPSKPGNYDFRMSDQDDHEKANETASASFTVK
jgi:hypothetical protein